MAESGSGDAMEAAVRRDFERKTLPLIDNLYGAAIQLTRDPIEAEDLVQDSMVKAYRFWHRYKPGTNIKSWLFAILRNTFINGYHRRRRGRKLKRSVKGQVSAIGPSVAVAGSVNQPRGPEDALVAEITVEKVNAALDTLPPDYRMSIVLADIEGLSYKEVADVMECPVGTVMSRIHRGRKMLHSRLYDHARDIGIVAPNDEPEAEADEQAPDQSADAQDDETSSRDAVDLAAYRDRRKKA